ncbi:carboxypeptidase-like regulatory domain-containing protein [Acidicapsa ligni]|uniref:carboxypeptidase-like regulatory domain-containing protein n=1 Tax=Acidicapsa ligni TaxID=542300 RepID=UPI0021E06F63|nr:carboxypeptidase-like regulatory domain-containing protein [Acidicapsa ligni]
MKTDSLRIHIASVAAIFLLFIGTAFGQTPGTGAISGVVSDPADRVVSNAQILAVNEATHVSRSVTTTSEGVFRVPLLPPGMYTVTVIATGFSGNTSHSIEVTVSATTSLNVKLAIAAASTSVQVTGGSAEVSKLESSTLGGLVDETAIRALPLSSRNYTQILGLAPGVVVDLPTATALGNGTQNVASNGATATNNNIQFNGVDANNIYENSASNAESSIVGTAIPAPDTIEEFRVQTANFDAAYGRGTGANVDLVSKSGTNKFHGSAWEFLRNNIFNANDFFSKLHGQPRADLKQNQFGASIGGPIRHDRTFFFGAYQGSTEVNGLGDEQNDVYPLLTADRSAAGLGAQFCPAGHLNAMGQPATGYLTLAGGTQVACDGSNINPTALAILNAKLPNGQLAVPSPQTAVPNSGSDPTDQLPLGASTYAIPAHYREDQFTVDLDQILNQKNTLSGRFFYARAPETLAFSPNGAANVPGWPTNDLSRNTMFVLADTHVFTSNLLNIARLGYTRFDGLSRVQSPITAQAIGIGTPTGAVGPTLSAPGLMVAGLTIGDAGTPSEWQVTNSFIYQDTIALTKGRHNMRYGAEFRRHQADINSPNETDGLLQLPSFDDFLLGQSAAQNGSPFGFSNVGTTQSGGGIFRRDIRYSDLAIFAQDDVKLTRRLTINAGLRYEIFGAPTEANGRLANFDANIAQQGLLPASGTFSGFTVPSNFEGTIPAGIVRTSYAGLWKTPHADVSPRLGFVWQMTEKPVLVLRGGYGIYYDQHSAGIVESGLSQPPYSTGNIIQGAANGRATLQSPYDPLVLPNSSYPIFITRSTATPLPFTQGSDPNIKDGRTQEYNLNVQYALGRDYLLEVGYVGTRSVHRPGQIEFNQSLLASPESPVNGETTNSVNNVAARQPFQGVPQGSLFAESVFVGNYNSLQISVTKRMTHGFQVQASYVWSKNLDELNGEGGNDTFETQLPTNDQHNLRQSSYGLAGDDRDQRIVANFTWTAPKFTSLPTLPRHVLTNWEFSGIGVIQSGAALSIFDGNAGSVYGNFNNRAQATGSSPSTHGSLFSRVVGSGRYLDATAFTRAPEAPNGTSLADQNFGNSSVGIVRGPGQHNLDMAVERVFPVKSWSSFRFRAEFFNVTNTPQFGNPNTSLGYGVATLPNPVASSGFGQISGEQGGPHPRIIQFAAKYVF